MGKPISLFSGYSQKENRTTNYCLLLLKMLYESNSDYFSEVVGGLIGYDVSDYVGVNFRQQEKRNSSVPDGLISQKSFSIYIETKNYDWFYDEQLEKHLESLSLETSGLKILLALGNFEGNIINRFDKIKKLCEEKYRNSIIFAAVTFEDFIQSFNITGLPKYLSDSVSELRSYLDEEQLLPSWQRWLDVINCAGQPDDVLKGNIYMCPAKTGAYTHGRCKYFGMYRQKRVEYVSDIEAVVDVEDATTATLLWKNINQSTTKLLERAKDKVNELRPNEYPVRIFLLGQLFETNFIKDSTGGMLGSKQYFDISRFDAENAQDLSNKLNTKVWSEWS